MCDIDMVSGKKFMSTQGELMVNLSPSCRESSSLTLFILSMQNRVAVDPEGMSEFH